MKLNIRLGDSMLARSIVIISAKLPCKIELVGGGYRVDAKSLIGVLALYRENQVELIMHTDDKSLEKRMIDELTSAGIAYSEVVDEPQKSYHVSAIGEILIDFTYSGRNAQGQRIFAQNPGGGVANVLAMLAKLGAETAFIGKAGDDMHGRFLKETLTSCGVDTSGFALDKDFFTTLAFVDVKDDGEREFSFARRHGADKMLTVADVPIDILEHSKIFHFSSVSLSDEPSRGATQYAVMKAKELGCLISYDPNFRASLWSDHRDAERQLRTMLSHADLVKVSDEEVELLTGKSDPRAAAERIIENGAKLVAVTLGKNGAYLRTPRFELAHPGYETTAVDATGAGDSFWGALLYKLISSEKPLSDLSYADLSDILRFSNAAASLCVENYGAIPALPDLAAILSRVGAD